MTMLTDKQAYAVMVLFLEGYYERTKAEDIGMLLSDLPFLDDGDTADPAAWEDWSQCVQTVLDAARSESSWNKLWEQHLAFRLTRPDREDKDG
jgi:hypothetical protein